MFPTLFSSGRVHVSAYGGSIALGFVLACVLTVRAGKRAGLPVWGVLDLCFWTLVAGLAGARLMFAATHVPLFVDACREASGSAKLLACTRVLHVWEGGLAFYGGVLAAALLLVLFARRRGWRFLVVADVVVPALALAHFSGRIGCFAAGCCYGREAAPGSFGAVVFREGSLALAEHRATGKVSLWATETPALVPVQLWEAAAELALFVLLTALATRKRFHGMLLGLWLCGYALARFTLEHWRGDPERGALGPWSSSQVIALGAGALGVVLLAVKWPRRRAQPEPGRG